MIADAMAALRVKSVTLDGEGVVKIKNPAAPAAIRVIEG